MEKALDFLSKLGKNLEYWVAHTILRDSALSIQALSLSWLVMILMASIPFCKSLHY